MNIDFREIHTSDLEDILSFTDLWIGKNYFGRDELLEIINLGQKNGINTSLKAVSDSEELAGVRLTLAPGNWVNSMRGLSTDLWKVEASSVGYFKSLFVSENFQKMGIGKSLSTLSIEQLKKVGAKAVICHSWLESPSNSSQRYLISMGFQPVKEYREFWSEIDYHCTKCGPAKCLCTAIEMIKYI
ncbi:GNAT family N-acetyltransferase [Halobacteriovorax sp. JY17]|uniref:GNAT family N-acetyltransferase n=1 Tax=Halobacteriovorax sp. JY17 TaxID=2014617 RepID=UPI000C5C25A7|nr:GNAT family N-acetyltransferase [Halobacteriovorax sp. JY17]PIK15183.1 MAG: GNAT family N-acetyltransferase [Halobacteriovorax sp. JY17]